MAKDQLRQLHEVKFQGLEGAVLDWQAGKIAKQSQSSEDAERVVEGLSLQKLVEGYADYRATQASQSAVSNYKRELVSAKMKMDDLNGRATAIQGHTYTITEISKLLVMNTNAILTHVAGIYRNTDELQRLRAIEGGIERMGKSLVEVTTRGVRVK